MNTKSKKSSPNKVNHSNNCSTSGYSSQTLSECDPSDLKRSQDTLSLSKSISPASSQSIFKKDQFLNIKNLTTNPKLIRTSTPTNLISNFQIASSLSTIASIKKSELEPTPSFLTSFINFILSLFSCFNIFKKSNQTFDNFDQNLPKILLKQPTPVVRQQTSSFVYPKQEQTYQIKTKIKMNSFISSTPNNRPNYNSFMYIDEKEIYDNMPTYSNESSQTSFNKAKYTVNTELSISNDKIKSTPLLSSSPMCQNLASSKSMSSVMSSNTSTSSAHLSQTHLSPFKKYSSDPIYSSNFKICCDSRPSNGLSVINLTRPGVPIYDDYLCDKEVESYFENPDYFDCYKKEILVVKKPNNKECSNYYYYYPDQVYNQFGKQQQENYLYLNSQGELKSKSTSTSSGIMSGATSASISTLSSIKSNNSIMNYAGMIRQYKGESYC